MSHKYILINIPALSIKSFFIATLSTISLVYLIFGRIVIVPIALYTLIGAFAMGFMLKATSSRKDYKIEIPSDSKMKFLAFFTLSVALSGIPAQPWSFMLGACVFILFTGRFIDGLSWKEIWSGKEL